MLEYDWSSFCESLLRKASALGAIPVVEISKGVKDDF